MKVARRARVQVWIPDGAAGHCCGMPFGSKGYASAARTALNRTIESLADDMEGGFNRETLNLERRQIKRWLRDRARQIREGEA